MESGKGGPRPERSQPAAVASAGETVWIMGESALEPGPVPGAPAAGGPVHAVTVVTLLEKLSSMLEGLQERVGGLASRQGGLAGSVLRIQRCLGELSSSHDRTSNRLEQLLTKAERVGSHADVAQERAVFRAAQMQRLEANHGLLVARGKLRVLLFKVRSPTLTFQIWELSPAPGRHLFLFPHHTHIPDDATQGRTPFPPSWVLSLHAPSSPANQSPRRPRPHDLFQVPALLPRENNGIGRGFYPRRFHPLFGSDSRGQQSEAYQLYKCLQFSALPFSTPAPSQSGLGVSGCF